MADAITVSSLVSTDNATLAAACSMHSGSGPFPALAVGTDSAGDRVRTQMADMSAYCMKHFNPGSLIWPDETSSIRVRLDDLARWNQSVRSFDPRTSEFNLTGGIEFGAGGRCRNQREWCNGRSVVKVGHNEQDATEALLLRQRYEHRRLLPRAPVAVMDLVRLLHFTVDMSDAILYYSSQLVHVAQVVLMVENDERVWRRHGRLPPDDLYWEHMKLAAVLHDLGKVLSLHNEPPQYVDSSNRMLCMPDASMGTVGLQSPALLQQFNHDEFGYFKLRANLPFRVSMVMRFHSSVHVHTSHQHVTERSSEAARGRGAVSVAIREHAPTAEYQSAIPFLDAFAHYDQTSKKRNNGDGYIPRVDWAWYERLLAKYFPGGLVEY